MCSWIRCSGCTARSSVVDLGVMAEFALWIKCKASHGGRRHRWLKSLELSGCWRTTGRSLSTGGWHTQDDGRLVGK